MISLNYPHFSHFQGKNSYKNSVMTLKNVPFWKKIINCKRGARAENSWNPIKFILWKYFDDIFWIANFFITVTVFLTDLKMWRDICKSTVWTEYGIFFSIVTVSKVIRVCYLCVFSGYFHERWLDDVNLWTVFSPIIKSFLPPFKSFLPPFEHS